MYLHQEKLLGGQQSKTMAEDERVAGDDDMLHACMGNMRQDKTGLRFSRKVDHAEIKMAMAIAIAKADAALANAIHTEEG